MSESTVDGQTPEEQDASVAVDEPSVDAADPAAEESLGLEADDIKMPETPQSGMEKEILAELDRQEVQPTADEPAGDEKPPADEDVLAELSALEQEEDESSEPQVLGDAAGEAPTVRPVQMGDLKRTGKAGKPRNIEILMDVKLPVAIELGRTQLSVNDILDLAPGSVVELNKLAGEPVDLLVNNKVVARGEVVVVDENFGLRVTSLISPEDRIKSL
jgi:flagellar motor switch protein FliN/FliY